MPSTISRECLVFATVGRVPISQREIKQCVFQVLTHLKIVGSLSIHCIGDTRMRRLNRQYRGKDSTTDVLTFRLHEGENAFASAYELGDIFISVPQIKRQSRRLSISMREEFIRMLIHGTLHILGYDHHRESDARIMFRLQEKILSQLV
jgi:probable rRNA maturation factor